jgi:H/ACA ribonucleoprotein complex subunit 4
MLNTLAGSLFQKHAKISGVKLELRMRTIYKSELLAFDSEKILGVFRVSFEAGSICGRSL